jgi:hypothetical protein
MIRSLSILAAFCGVCLIVGSANAQSIYQDRPTVSPYLNLLRTDQTFGNGVLPPNYQTLVRPQIEARENILSQRQQINQLQQQQGGRPQGGSGPIRSFGATGHRGPDQSPVRYLNYSHYYPTLSSRFAR